MQIKGRLRRKNHFREDDDDDGWMDGLLRFFRFVRTEIVEK